MKLLAALLLLCAVEVHADAVHLVLAPAETTITVGSTFWVRINTVDVPTVGWAGFDFPMVWTGFNTGNDIAYPFDNHIEPLCMLAGYCPDAYGTTTCNHEDGLSFINRAVDGDQSNLCGFPRPPLRDGPLARIQFTALRLGDGVIGIDGQYGWFLRANGAQPNLTVNATFGDWCFLHVIDPPSDGCGYCCTHYCDEGLVAARKASWGRVKAIYR